MNPFVTRFNNQPWIWPITGMCLVLGFMISMAWVNETNRSSRIGFVSGDQRSRISASISDPVAAQEMEAEIKKLRAEKTKLENAIGTQDSQTKALNDSLQETKAFAGLTEMEGPGIVVTLKDDPNATANNGMPTGLLSSDQIIHDTDVLRVVNELFSGGAEAISVDGIRVAAGSSFRCVGPTILVNDMKIAAPIVIEAVGDPNELYGGMNLPGGVLQEIRQQNPAMVTVEKAKKLRLTAFVGNTAKRLAKVPKDKK